MDYSLYMGEKSLLTPGSKVGLMADLLTRQLSSTSGQVDISLSANASSSGSNFSRTMVAASTLGTSFITLLSNNYEYLGYRTGFELIRCEVGSMQRLRVTKGVCLPSDYPIHIICGSKDVIHS